MPFAPHLRITALGRFGNSPEKFSYGINMSDPGQDVLGLDLGLNKTGLDDIASDIIAFHTRPATKIGGYAVLEAVKIAKIGPDGKYTDDPYVYSVSPGQGGGANDNPMTQFEYVPPQSALAVSLGSSLRGAGGRGRFFIPTPVVKLDAGLRMSAADAQGIRDSAQTLISALNNQPGIDVLDLRVVIASTKGVNTPVTKVRVGRAVDTIRSRRSSLLEEYAPYVNV